MSAPTVQNMTRTHAESVKTKNPMLEHVAALEERIAALEKEVSHLRSIPKKKSLKAIKPPANLKVMGKREQKKRGILAQLELLNVPADISMSTPELKALLSKNKKAESSRKKTEAEIKRISAKADKAELKLKKKKDAEEKEKAKLKAQKEKAKIKAQKEKEKAKIQKEKAKLKAQKEKERAKLKAQKEKAAKHKQGSPG